MNHAKIKSKAKVVLKAIWLVGYSASASAYTFDYYDIFGVAESTGRVAPLIFDGTVNSTSATLYHNVINQAHLQAGLDDMIFLNSDPLGSPNLSHSLVNQAPVNGYYYAGSRAYIHTNKVTIQDITVVSEDVQFIFDKPSSTMGLVLKNGVLDLNHAPTFLSTNPLELTVDATVYGTTSTLRRFTADISASTTITINAGSTLKILDTGNAYSTSATDYLRFRESADINVGGGASFIVDASKVVLEKGSISANGGTVTTQGSAAYLKTYDMTLENSSVLNVGLSTELVSVSNGLRLDASSINTLRTVEAGDLYVIGTSTIFGGGTVAAGVTLPDQSAFTLNLNDATLKTGRFLDVYGSTVNIAGGATFELLSGGSLYMDGTTFNINDGQMIIHGAMGVEDRGTINIASGARLYIGREATLRLDSTNHTTIDAVSGSNIVVTGELTGAGYVGDAGSEIDIQSVYDGGTKVNGNISPGFGQFSDSSRRIGSITTDAKLFIEAEGYPSVVSSQAGVQSFKDVGYSGGVYTVDIDPQNLAQTSDKIVYGAGNVDLTFMEHIAVQSPNTALTADDLHLQEFTVIEAQNSAVTGDLRTGYNSYDPNDINVQQDGSIPALIGFSVINKNTNSKADVTLKAEKSIGNLSSKIDPTQTNLSATSGLLTNVFNAATSSSINASLNTLTNSQLTSSLSSIHPEPYSSYMNVSLEGVDWVMNSVMAKTYAHANTNKDFWVDSSFTDGKVSGRGSLGSYGYRINSLILGGDVIRNADVGTGLYLGMTQIAMNEHDSASQRFKSNNILFGLYHFDHGFGDYTLTSSTGVSYNQHETSRYTFLGSYAGTQTANFKGHSIYGALELAHKGYGYKNLLLRPRIGFGYGYVFQESVREQGNDLRLNIDADRAQMLVTSVGLNIQPIGVTSNILPTFSIKYEHDWKARQISAHDMTGALGIAPDSKESFLGQNRGSNHLAVGIGFSSTTEERLSLDAGLSHTVSEHGRESSLFFNMVYKFQ